MLSRPPYAGTLIASFLFGEDECLVGSYDTIGRHFKQICTLILHGLCVRRVIPLINTSPPNACEDVPLQHGYLAVAEWFRSFEVEWPRTSGRARDLRSPSASKSLNHSCRCTLPDGCSKEKVRFGRAAHSSFSCCFVAHGAASVAL